MDLLPVDDDDALRRIFALQFDLQEKILGQYVTGLTLTERIAYIKEMVLAATDELHELLGEVSWKSWASVDPYINRDRAVKEAVDVMHFVVNIMLTLGVSPEELLTRYVSKNAVNHKRQDDGYDGVSTKCAGCSRALEDITILETRDSDPEFETLYRCPCGEQLDADVAKRFITD